MKGKAADLKDPLIVTGPEGKGKIEVDFRILNKAALGLRAMYHPLRKKLLQLIDEKGKISVGELYGKLKIEQSVASNQLAILRKAGIVHAQRDGQRVYYSVNGKRISDIISLARDLAAGKDDGSDDLSPFWTKLMR